jgi:hypothetical protein
MFLLLKSWTAGTGRLVEAVARNVLSALNIAERVEL